MADQVVNVNCGFFDAINDDRTYYAADMNRPYKRLISNGVFATPQGQRSTDLQVLAGGGLSVNVSAGEGLFADRWFENPSSVNLTVPANAAGAARIDSVLVQVDTRASGRVGSIVYREGTAGALTPPQINTVAGVVEYRVANVTVAPAAVAISNANISDMRGSAECPWVTGLIKQVDISVLFTQWQTAYEEYYRSSTTEFEEYVAEQRDIWEAFVETLTTELTVSTNVIKYTSAYRTAGGETAITVDIAAYAPDADVLLVFMGGALLAEGVDYTLVAANKTILLRTPAAAGKVVSFVVLHSVATPDVETVIGDIQRLSLALDAATQDTGWNNINIENATPDPNNPPKIRRIGKSVTVRGAISGAGLGFILGMLPPNYAPTAPHRYTTAAVNTSTNVAVPVVVQIAATGSIAIVARAGEFGGSQISLATTFLLD